MLQVCRFTHLELGDPVPCHELGQDRWGHGSIHSHVDSCMNTMLKVGMEGVSPGVNMNVRGEECAGVRVDCKLYSCVTCVTRGAQ